MKLLSFLGCNVLFYFLYAPISGILLFAIAKKVKQKCSADLMQPCNAAPTAHNICHSHPA